ncbi:MAG: hypothetical protein R2710_21675 [Acidimicrobiales bacterium]
MTDYLYIDTTRARTAAPALRSRLGRRRRPRVDHRPGLPTRRSRERLGRQTHRRRRGARRAGHRARGAFRCRRLQWAAPYQSRSMALGDLTMLLYGATPPTPANCSR